MEEIVSFESAGGRLQGILGRSEAPGPYGAILIHGWSGYRIGPQRLLVQTSRALNAHGVTTLRFDLRGRGESEGDVEATDLDGMIEDACAAVDFLAQIASPERIAAVGICSGGNVVIGAATLDPRIEKLVLWSTLPFVPQKRAVDHARKKMSYAGEYVRKIFRAETWRKLAQGAINFGMIRKVLFGKGDLQTNAEGRNPKDSRRDIMADFARYTGEALFVYGGNDPEAPGARDVYERFCRQHGIRTVFVFIDGANHNFYAKTWKQELIETSVRWLVDGETPRIAEEA